MTFDNRFGFSHAITDFHRARNQAVLKEIIGRIRGESVELLSYEEVRQKLRVEGSSEQGLQNIPIEAIVGSIGRYNDFTRDFLPRRDSIQERWARVKLAVTGSTGLPPIDVYQIGEAYFVKDGNHRVSVAKQMGANYIQAYVTEVRTRVPITPDIEPDELILKAELASFLEISRLDEVRPGSDLSVTLPGKYPIIQEHIDVHRYFMGIEQQREIPYIESVTHWYDTVYMPLIETIRERGILHNFPNRTETDLYLWITIHRHELEEELEWEIKLETALNDLVESHGTQFKSSISRFGDKLLSVLSLGKLEEGPPPGQWRTRTVSTRKGDRLFTEILVPLSSKQESWVSLNQAFVVAHHENAAIHGLHIIANQSDIEDEIIASLRDEFERRCHDNDLQGELAVTSGEIARQISDRARWNDLVITHLAHPPASSPKARLDSGFHELIQRCPRPILAVPGQLTPLDNALLAYDGSPKSEEALFVATYMAGKWNIRLTVVTVFEDNNPAQETMLRAKAYLEEHGIQANFKAEKGSVGEALLKVMEKENINLIIMGGYGASPVVEFILGSVVDKVLRESQVPILICR
ncbi:MAG: universal stress protein [Anaerolineales bacterium]|nr:MAG: universal stress protein [Anaerolineales bacterium]